jgi:hypothetical protein
MVIITNNPLWIGEKESQGAPRRRRRETGSSGEEEPPARSRSRGKTSGIANRKRPAPAGRQEAMETLNGPVPGPKELCIAAGKLRAKEDPVVSPPPLVSPLECCVEWERRQVGKRGI